MINIQKKCNGCHACYSACPKKCIKMVADSEGFLYPQVDSKECINCGKCINVCPILSSEKPNLTQPNAYAIVNKRDDVLKRSSSGGVFYALATATIEKNGVVFGATFNKDGQVEHSFIDNEHDVWKMMGSKYAQSKIGNSFILAKDSLDNGREVLFVGTPCQIGGLRAFLGKEYENLLCVDIICHGVPSPKLWNKYVEYQENKHASKAVQISFRDKSTSWRAYSMNMIFENGKVYQKPHEEDAYMRLFLSNVCLRPSCHDCYFKGVNRLSDITLADCWGVERVLGEKDDDKGVSLTLTHTKKGENALQSLFNSCQIRKVDLDKAIKENPSAIRSAIPHKDREEFFAKMDKSPVSKSAKKYAPYKIGLKERLARLLKKIGIWKLIKK